MQIQEHEVCTSKKGFDDISSIITTFGLKDYLFFGRGMGWGELNGIPSPRGKAKAEQCWNKWFMLLSSQVNSTAFQLSVHQFSREERVKKLRKQQFFFSLPHTYMMEGDQADFFFSVGVLVEICSAMSKPMIYQSRKSCYITWTDTRTQKGCYPEKGGLIIDQKNLLWSVNRLRF